MMGAKIVICGVFVAAFAAVFAEAQLAPASPPSAIQATSTAKNLKDLSNEVLKIINSNKSGSPADVIPQLIAQTTAGINSMRAANYYPSQTEITTAVQTIVSQLPKDGPITGDVAQRFQNGITRHLSRSFPVKSTTSS
jgi:hypothetical protein